MYIPEIGGNISVTHTVPYTGIFPELAFILGVMLTELIVNDSHLAVRYDDSVRAEDLSLFIYQIGLIKDLSTIFREPATLTGGSDPFP